MEDLVKRWQAGEEAAFDELFHRFKWLVYRNALLITGDEGEAEDTLQEVFIIVWKSRRQFDAQKGKFYSWLYRITLNKSISRRRKNRGLPRFLDEVSLDQICSSRPQLEKALECKREYDRLKVIVDKMDDKHRLVLIMKYFNDLRNDDIADILNIPLGTVKSRLHNALAMLRRQMKEADSEME
ncbi:MAG: sigma-70 family RNA polymerase sigma factor [Dehalococcoidaceae bacterium]|nr:sigma-70 family RNA polymerase sigma factor [Dehalococcoidaceae bacterium]